MALIPGQRFAIPYFRKTMFAPIWTASEPSDSGNSGTLVPQPAL
jgi:hypothetical protein